MSSIFPDPEVFRYALWDYLFFVYFIVYILPLAAGSFSLAKKVCREDFYERFAFASLLTLLCGGLIFALAALAVCLVGALLRLLIVIEVRVNVRRHVPVMEERIL